MTAAFVHGGTVYVGGSFPQLFTPSASVDQFYDPLTALTRPECARTTNPAAGLNPTPDGTGGLLVAVQPGDAYADEVGPFTPPAGTTVVRIASTCLWDRAFAAGVINPSDPANTTIGLPVRAGNVVYTANAIIAPDTFLRAQMAAFNAITGDRIGYREFPDIAEIGLIGAGPQGPVARVRLRDSFDGQYVLAAFNPDTLEVTWSTSALADEPLNPKFWVRGTTLFRLRPPPTNTLEAYDLATLAPKAGWVPPLVPALADLEVVGNRVFLTSRTVNGQVVPQPAALIAATGAIDPAWTPPVLERRGAAPPTPYTPVLTHLGTDGQRLFFSGDYQLVNNVDREGIAALRLSDATLDDWNPAPVIASPLEFAAGGFLLMTRPTSANRVWRRYLAAIDVATGVATAWDPNDPARILLHNVSPISAMATDGTYVYFASASTGELQRAHIVSADVDQNWRFIVLRADGRPGNIDTIVERDGMLYLSGEFDSIGGVGVPRVSRRGVAAVGADGTLFAWAPLIEGAPGVKLVRSMLRLGGAVYLGGAFTLVNGEVRQGFAAVDAVTHELVQPEMIRPGYTRINGLATDGARVFLAGESYGAPLVGSAAIPTSVLTPFRVYDGQIPTGAAYVAGGVYAGLEYDPDGLGPTSRATRWSTVSGGPSELLHVTAADGTLEFYPGQPGPTPGSPALSASVSGNIVVLSWTPAAGAAPTSYTLFAGSAPGASNIVAFAMGPATSLVTAAPDGGYYVRVVPRNRFGAGTPSNEVFVRVGPEPCTTAPPSPTDLAFTAAGLAVRLTWNAAATAANYTVEAGQTPGAVNLANFAVGNVTTITTSAPPAVYYVRTRAHNACGTSAPSNEVAITLGGPVEVPQPPTNLSAVVDGRTVIVRWTPPTSGGLPSGFLLEAGNAPGLANVAVYSTGVPGLVAANVPSAVYYVRVRSYNAAGLGAATSDITVTVP